MQLGTSISLVHLLGLCQVPNSGQRLPVHNKEWQVLPSETGPTVDRALDLNS
jgi:hypothetical protein